jgi:hypothetical protein
MVEAGGRPWAGGVPWVGWDLVHVDSLKKKNIEVIVSQHFRPACKWYGWIGLDMINLRITVSTF